MERRDFLKATAAAAVTLGLPGRLGAAGSGAGLPKESAGPAASAFPDFRFPASGKFKVVQLTDTHYIAGDPRSARALSCVQAVLDAEKPDLVIHTGDVVYGRPAAASAREILSPMAERGIPFAVALGNHDNEFDLNRQGVYNLIRSLPGCINTEDGLCDGITLSSDSGVERVLYLFDSADNIYDGDTWKGYGSISFDQIAWYRERSAAFTAHFGHPLPSMAFFHIPLRELSEGLAATSRQLDGNSCEAPCPSLYNTGLLASIKEMGDIQAIVTGHDHDCDFEMAYDGLFYLYGRFSGCDTVYNNLGLSGARLLEFTRGEASFRTWLRLADGTVLRRRTLIPGKNLLGK